MKATTLEVRLSSYLDGELDLYETLQVSEQIRADKKAQQCVLSLLQARSLLQAYAREDIQTKVPSALAQTAVSKHTKQGTAGRSRYLQAALIIITLLAGFSMGKIHPDQDIATHTQFIPQLAKQYEHVVQSTLERDLSGTTRRWEDQLSQAVVEVTPVQTFKDKNGTYHRMFTLSVQTKEERHDMTCLAYRNSQKKWQTRTIHFLEDSPGAVNTTI